MSGKTIGLETMMPVEATQLVDDVMRRWPMTIRAFLNNKRHCVGCPITCFHTIADACREHGVDQTQFLSELNAIIGEQAFHSSECESGVVAAHWPA
jgi:hybrid cluster-associated redox disulfide protein